MAEYVGVSTSTVSRWIQGRSLPERHNIVKLARYLDVPATEIEALLPTEQASPNVPAPAPLPAGIFSSISSINDPQLEFAAYRTIAAVTDPTLSSEHSEELRLAMIEGLKRIGRWKDARGDPAS